MKIAIVLNSSEPETAWNAVRFGVAALAAGHEATLFLIGRGVEYADVKHETFNVQEQVENFIRNKGRILACGTCLKLREKEGGRLCPVSTMNDLLNLVEESDKVLTFG
jgi:uncharacterized protein involved in oxidation of intracellular sulfur